MIIKGIYFLRKEIHKGTWRAIDGTTIKKIDHVLIKKGEKHTIKKIRTFIGPDTYTDHYIVGIKMTQIIPFNRNLKRQKYKTDVPIRLILTEQEAKYKKKMEAAMSTLEGTMDIGRLWYEIKISMERAAEEWKMVDRERSNKAWLDEECKKNWKKEMNRERK